MAKANDLLRARAAIRDTLTAAVRATDDEHEQHLALLDTVNRIRAGHRLPAVDMAVIEQIDRSAVMHADWQHKVVLRCATLAVGEEWRG